MTEPGLPEEPHEESPEGMSEVREPTGSTPPSEESVLNGWQLEADQDNVTDGDEDWPAEDLESAYRRALEANSAVEWDFARIPDGSDPNEISEEIRFDAAAEQSRVGSDLQNEQTHDTGESLKDVPERVTARQLIEAALFVGGDSLTTKRLCFMLRGDYDLDYIEDTIGNLNQQYEREMRPYEIRLGEGGYRLVLHDEFQRIRNRVFGVGPREIRLSQSVLEVLALVAYRQPVSQKAIEDQLPSTCGPVLRQLLRRELIAIQRDDKNRKKVEYVTTKRFLSVFGLGSISELPQADELGFR